MRLHPNKAPHDINDFFMIVHCKKYREKVIIFNHNLIKLVIVDYLGFSPGKNRS
jgi:hypothetical protein